MDPALLISLIVNAVIGLFAFYQSKYWPARQKEREGTQAFDQKTRGDAFTQVLDINKQLIEHVIGLSNGRFDRLVQKTDDSFKEIIRTIDEGDKARVVEMSRLTEAMNRMTGILTELRGQMGVVSRDWSRWSEIVSDIDQELDTIKELIKAILIKTGIRPEPGS